METIINNIMSGFTLGAIYSLLAVAFVLVMKATDIVHFALGEFLMIGIVSSLILNQFGVPLLPAAVLGTGVSVVLSYLMDRLVVRPLKDSPIVNIVFATVAVSIILQNAVLIFWRGDTVSFPSFFRSDPVVFMRIKFVPEHLAVILIACLCVFVLQLFFTKTKFGIAMRSVMDDREAASLMGVSVDRIISLAFMISGALAAIAGILVAPLTNVTYDMGVILIKVFVAAVIGGLYSIPGAIGGGILLGLMENFTTSYVTSTYRDVFVYSLLILGLLLKPSGLFAWRKV